MKRTNTISKRSGRTEVLKKANDRQLAFFVLYFKQEIDGKPNPYFGNATKAAIKVGYSAHYAKQILSRIQKQGGEMSAKVRDSRKTVYQALEDAEITTDWVAELIKRLGETPKQAQWRGKFIDSEHPDTHAARVALENVAKILGLYEPETVNVNVYDKLNDKELDDEIDAIANRIFDIRKEKRLRNKK